MRLGETDAWRRVRRTRHGVLGTIHPERGIDLVPVVYAVTDDQRVFMPVDTVKPKSPIRLRRLENIESDARCTLLVEHFDDDWSELWWVRIHGTAEIVAVTAVDWYHSLLAEKYPQYADPGSVVGGICLLPSGISAWAADAYDQ